MKEGAVGTMTRGIRIWTTPGLSCPAHRHVRVSQWGVLIEDSIG